MKEKRLREADPIVEENKINETPMQASTQEVMDAQSNAEAPVESAVADEAPQETPDVEVPEGSEGLGAMDMGGMEGGRSVASDASPEFGSGIKVNPETVSMEIEVPTDQLASAVAQATGDVVPAETAPDIEQAKEEELVAQQQEEAEPSMEGSEEEPSPLEAEAPMGEESMEQSVPVESLDTEPQTMGEKKMSPSKKVDIRFKKKLDSIIDNGTKTMAKSLKESEEDFEEGLPAGLKIDGDSVYFEGEYVGFIGNSDRCIYVSIEKCEEAEDYFLERDWTIKRKYDFGKPIRESEETPSVEENVFLETPELGDTSYNEELPEGYADESEKDEALENAFQDVSDEDVSEFMGRLEGYLNDEETTPQDVSDALRTSADFMDMVGGEEPSNTPLMDTIKDTEDFDFDSLIDGEYENAESRDEVIEDDRDDDFEEALVRKPCKFPKDKTSIKETRNRRVNRLKETQITDSYDLLSGKYKPWGGAESTWGTLEEMNLLEDFDNLLEDIYPDGLSETELNDMLWFDSDWVFESLGITDEEGNSKFIDDETDLEESKKVVNKKRIKESRRPMRRLKEGPGAGYTLEIEDLEILDSTLRVTDYSYKDNSCTFTVDVADGAYGFSVDHSDWGGVNTAEISDGTLTGIYYIEDNSYSFIDDDIDESALEDTAVSELIEDIKAVLPSYVTVSTIVGGGSFHSDIDTDFILEDRYNGIAKLKEPASYYLEFFSFKGHSEDLGYMVEDMYNGDSRDGYYDYYNNDFDESKKVIRPKNSKLNEASEIIYPAGSGPSESSALYRKNLRRDSNLVKAHERVVENRRKAIKNFHESVNNRPSPIRNRRFNEALRSPLSYSNISDRDLDTSSWKKNRFIDKYEESQKLDFNTLLNEGYLG